MRKKVLDGTAPNSFSQLLISPLIVSIKGIFLFQESSCWGFQLRWEKELGAVPPSTKFFSHTRLPYGDYNEILMEIYLTTCMFASLQESCAKSCSRSEALFQTPTFWDSQVADHQDFENFCRYRIFFRIVETQEFDD